MATLAKTSVRCVALVGNPNTGKSTLFSALSGVRQHVGNYPGTTVEKKVGRFRAGSVECELVDLPGTYSLAPHAPDELVAVDVLLARRKDVPRPDVILCVVDASNLERNMYLVSQLLELELPMVVALNMLDVAASGGVTVDAKALSARLGVTAVPIHAKKGVGLDVLKAAMENAKATTNCPRCFASAEVQREIDQLAHQGRDHDEMPRFLVERLLFDEAGHLTSAIKKVIPRDVAEAIASARQRCLALDPLLAETEAKSRYQWIDQQLSGVVRRDATIKPSATDRADRLLLHPVWGWAVVVMVMLVLFQSVFLIAEPASNLIDEVTGWLDGVISDLVPAGALQSLLSDGIIAGVGGVLVFLPQIFLLFFFIALLEDSGYLARVACLMDRLLSKVGLSGKSFIPLLSSFACAIPGIMATRMIGDRRDRLVTILIAPLMSCSARLPVYTLLIAAFIPKRQWLGGLLGLQGLTMAAMYALGIVVAVLVAMILKKTLLRAETPPFLMELPTYKWPSHLVVVRRVWDGGWSFVQGAGTLIVSVTVLVWAAAYYPSNSADVDSELFARQREIRQLLIQTERTSESSARRTCGVESGIGFS